MTSQNQTPNQQQANPVPPANVQNTANTAQNMEQNQNDLQGQPAQPISATQPNPENQSADLQGAKKPSKFNLPKIKLPKAFVFALVGIIILVLILGVLTLFLGRPPRVNDVIGNGEETQEPSPTPTQNTSEECIYCDDPDILNLQEGISEFDSKLRDVNLREDTLRIPTLEWDVNF